MRTLNHHVIELLKAEVHKKSLRLKNESEAWEKTATTYSPTVTQYHRRDWA